RRDCRCTDFDRFVDGLLRVFPFWDRLSEDDLAAQWRCLRCMYFPQANLVVLESSNFHSHFATPAIEQDNLLPCLHSQDIAREMCFGAAQCECRALPLLRRNVETMHVTSWTYE